MGCAPIAHVLFNKFMTFNPQNPDWVNRDRFVLSYVHDPFRRSSVTDDAENQELRVSYMRAITDKYVEMDTDVCFSMLCFTCSGTRSHWTISKLSEYVCQLEVTIKANSCNSNLTALLLVIQKPMTLQVLR